MTERIECAAVRYRDKVWWLTRPCRHGHVLHMLSQALGEDYRRDEERAEQGFLTSTKRFVDRLEAVQVAIAAGQISAPKWPPDLYTEDLW